MPYVGEISRSNPSCFVFVIDQSGSMNDIVDPTKIRRLDEPVQIDGRTYTHTGQGRTKAQGVADAINRLLQNLVIRCAKELGPEPVRDYYHVGVIGYGASVGPAFGGALAGRDLVPVRDIANMPARVEERTKKVDDGAGGLVDQKIKFPIWFEPVANGGTPMCQALGQARTPIEGWLSQHPNCFPPTVIHITDGESTDGPPLEAMQALTALSSSDGNVLLFNVHLSASPNATPISFPDSAGALPDEYARTLFDGASHLTPFMRSVAQKDYGLALGEGAKGYVLNADMTLVITALDMGTRASNMR